MAKFTREEAIQRLENIAEKYSKTETDNPLGVLKVADNPNRRALVATSISYRLMAKILYVLGRCDHEYWIRSENDNALIMIIFY